MVIKSIISLYRCINPLLAITLLCCYGCNQQDQEKKTLVVGLSADYPPFEFIHHDSIVGLSVNIAKAISQKMNWQLEVKDMSFHLLFPALSTKKVDLVISSVSETPVRAEVFDFSNPYYYDSPSILCRSHQECSGLSWLKYQKKRVGCQLGSSHETWAKQNLERSLIISMDNTAQLIEALKSGLIDAVILDSIQAKIFFEENHGKLEHQRLAEIDVTPFQVLMQKNSPYLSIVNEVLAEMKSDKRLGETVILQFVSLLKNRDTQ